MHKEMKSFFEKIGVFPFITQGPTKMNSINRVVGTLVTKPITSVNKEVVKLFLNEKILLIIKVKWPRDDLRCPIFIK